MSEARYERRAFTRLFSFSSSLLCGPLLIRHTWWCVYDVVVRAANRRKVRGMFLRWAIKRENTCGLRGWGVVWKPLKDDGYVALIGGACSSKGQRGFTSTFWGQANSKWRSCQAWSLITALNKYDPMPFLYIPHSPTAWHCLKVVALSLQHSSFLW